VNPVEETVTVANIDSWRPFLIGDATIYTMRAFWPVFSKDGTYLALEQFDWDVKDATADPENARLAIINLETQQSEVYADLSDTLQEGLFISEWLTH
jgi:hypothetical protein